MSRDRDVEDLMSWSGASREEAENAYAKADEIMTPASDPQDAADWVYPDDLLAGTWWPDPSNPNDTAFYEAVAADDDEDVDE